MAAVQQKQPRKAGRGRAGLIGSLREEWEVKELIAVDGGRPSWVHLTLSLTESVFPLLNVTHPPMARSKTLRSG